MSWNPAPSVAAALHEADQRWPHRRRDSDGILGDAAHQATASDHNPDSRGIVHAFDITASGAAFTDPNTPQGNELVATILRRKDIRVAYTIWNRRIWRAYPHLGVQPWQPSTYTGSSPHTEHVHVSIWSDLNQSQAGLPVDHTQRDFAEDDLEPWWTAAPQPVLEEEEIVNIEPGEFGLVNVDGRTKVQIVADTLLGGGADRGTVRFAMGHGPNAFRVDEHLLIVNGVKWEVPVSPGDVLASVRNDAPFIIDLIAR